MELHGFHLVSGVARRPQAQLVRKEERKNRFWNRGMRVLRLVGCWEAELGEILSSYSGFPRFSYTHMSVFV